MAYNLIRTWGMLVSILLFTVFASAKTPKTAFTHDRDSLKKAIVLPPNINSKQLRTFPQLEQYVQSLQTSFSLSHSPTYFQSKVGWRGSSEPMSIMLVVSTLLNVIIVNI
jgi:hypothetical protein